MKENKDLLVVGNLAKDLIRDEAKFGGSAASIAVNARRLGISTGILSVLGKDDFSVRYRTFLGANGVNSRLITSPLAELPVCEVVSNGNTIGCSEWHDNGCHPAMEEMEIKTGEIEQYRAVHLVSCPPGLAEQLSELGVTLSYEPGPMLVVDPNYFDPHVAARSKFIFLNEEESDVVMKSQGHNTPDQILTNDRQILVITRGKQGSELFTRDTGVFHHQHMTAKRVDDLSIVDHIGAGDGYKAGFLSAYLLGHNFLTCARVGSEVGALAVQQAGGIIERQKLAYLSLAICHG